MSDTADRPVGVGERPSFLVVVTDQLPAHALGYAGDPLVETPNIDRLAADSLIFDEAHVANPICAPNRASMLTGRFPSAHGVRTNGIPLDHRAMTLPRALRAVGYRTGAAGKLHLQPYGAAQEVMARLAGPAAGAVKVDGSGWDGWEMRDRHAREPIELPEDYYGFDDIDLVIGGSDTAEGPYRHWLRSQGVDPAEVQGRANALAAPDEWDQVYKPALPEELYPTTYITDRTIEFLERAARSDVPFFFWSSFPDPHHPFTPPGRFYEMYGPDDVALPDTFGDPLTGAPPHLRAMVAERGEQRRPFDCWAPTERQLRLALAAAYGMITMVDEGIGRILATLERTGLSTRTVVVFTSDHGDMFGEHGLLLKHCVHYRSCTRVPLVISSPRARTGRTDALVSSLDLAPTVLGLAGVESYRDLHGIDLTPLLAGEGALERDALMVEEDEMFGLPGLDPPVRMRTLVTREARLTRYHGEPFGELFDLVADRDETYNRHAEPGSSGLRTDMTSLLLETVLGVQDSGIAPRFTA